MTLLKSLFSRRPDASESGAGQTLPQKMNLEERMAYRRDMLFEAIGIAMDANGFGEETYRLRVSRIDKRGHVYAVMITLAEEFLNDTRASQAALREIGKDIVATSGSSGVLQVNGVYWSVEEHSASGASRPTSPSSDPKSLLSTWPTPRSDQRIYASDIAPLS